MTVDLRLGDCRDLLPTVVAQSVDAVITDPPYPEISRAYGRMTEAEWWDMMMAVCTEVRRILKPSGSAVFILQPNSRKVGSMRGWLWEFMAWVCREWNMVQDVWWWNYNAIPSAFSIQGGFMRPSIKACVWAGNESCWHDQDKVLVIPTPRLDYLRRWNAEKPDQKQPSGHHTSPSRIDKTFNRNGSSPFNLIPVTNGTGLSQNNAGKHGHGAGTPLALADWWTRYIVPPGGVVCDPFMGSGTMGIAAVKRGHGFIGFEKMDAPGYYPTAVTRIAGAQEQMRLVA